MTDREVHNIIVCYRKNKDITIQDKDTITNQSSNILFNLDSMQTFVNRIVSVFGSSQFQKIFKVESSFNVWLVMFILNMNVSHSIYVNMIDILILNLFCYDIIHISETK